MNWEDRQRNEYEYWKQHGDIGTFSHKDLKEAIYFGWILNKYLSGQTCLDIGCGLVPCPAYIENSPEVIWAGIDPYTDPVERCFEFRVGRCEKIPFRRRFDAVAFGTSLDHLEDYDKSLSEVKRVTDQVFVWCSVLSNEEQKLFTGDNFHGRMFSNESLIDYFKDFDLKEYYKLGINSHVYIFKKL